MKERPGVAKGIDISTGFAESPAAKARQAVIKQLKALTPEERISLTRNEPVQANQSGGDEGYITESAKWVTVISHVCGSPGVIYNPLPLITDRENTSETKLLS
jgi:hypothetical protein